METYFLSSEASDNAARQVAAVENGVVQLEPGSGARHKGDVLKSILWDMAQSEFQEESSYMAETVQDSMSKSLRLVNRGVKQAGFYVLGGAAMPAILIEIGFLTNRKEEKKLGTIELLAECRHRLCTERALRGGEIDQVTVVRHHRTDAGLAHALVEQVDLRRWEFPRAPLPSGFGEDLQRVAARGLRAIHGPRQSAGDRQVGSDPRHRYSPKTSASKRKIAAPCCQASSGRPALWQVCRRNCSGVHPHSTATCGSRSPRREPCSATRP